MNNPPDIERLRQRLAMATATPWELQDGCSWRRIGTQGRDGNVLCPTNSLTDNHVDLTAGRGESVYANLALAVEAVNALPHLLDRIAIMEEVLGKVPGIFQDAIEHGYPWPREKVEQCEHGKFKWEDCIACYDEFLMGNSDLPR